MWGPPGCMQITRGKGLKGLVMDWWIGPTQAQLDDDDDLHR